MAQHPLVLTASVCLLHVRLFTLQAHRWLTALACIASATADLYGNAHVIVVGVSVAMAFALTLLCREFLHHQMMIALAKRPVRAIDRAWYQAHSTQAPLAESLTLVEGQRTAIVTCCRTVQS